MRNSVIIDGLTLTREQVVRALTELNASEPVRLVTSGISFGVPLSNGQKIFLRDERESHQGQGLYLESVPGSSWVIKKKGTPGNTWQLLTLEEATIK